MRPVWRVLFGLLIAVLLVGFVEVGSVLAQVPTTTAGQSPTGSPDQAPTNAESLRLVWIALVGGAMYLLVRTGRKVRSRRRQKAQTG